MSSLNFLFVRQERIQMLGLFQWYVVFTYLFPRITNINGFRKRLLKAIGTYMSVCSYS